VRRKLTLAALALITLGASMTVSPTSAGAATLLKSSWWYKPHTSDAGSLMPPGAGGLPAGTPTAPAPIPAPAPPTVAAGSVLVEGTAEGADAMAGLSWTMAAGETAPTLTIKPSSTSSVPAGSIILACRAAVEWTKPDAEPGTWESKPLVDCSISVQGVVNADGTIGFGLAPLVSGNALDVVLAPGLAQTSPANVGSTFSLSFDPKTDATLKTDASGADFVAPEPFASGSSGLDYSSPGTGASFSVPSAPIAQPALEPQEQMLVVPRQDALAPTKPVASDTKGRSVAFLILLAGLAFGGLAYLTPARDAGGTMGLGRFTRPVPAEVLAVPQEPVDGGLGRFQRPRTGPPPAHS
jgi:hypothetical protein